MTRLPRLAVAVFLMAPGVCLAQTPATPRDARPGLGAMVGAGATADRNAVDNPLAVDVAVNGDMPALAGWRLRAEFGRARWTFDGNDGIPVPLPPETVTLTRVTASVLRGFDWPVGSLYAGGGGGAYHYASKLSPVPKAVRPGLHATIGSEIGSGKGRLAFRLELQWQAIGGPNAAVAAGTLQPVDRLPPDGSRSRVFSDVLFNVVVGAGIGWRF